MTFPLTGNHFSKMGATHSHREDSDDESEGLIPPLDEEVEAALRGSWALIREKGQLERLGSVHFKYFLERGGEAARKLYTGVSLQKQQHAITPVVEWILENPDNGAVQAIAVYHAHLGVNSTQLQCFCECFIDAIMEVLGEHGTEEIRDQWVSALTNVASVIGAQIELVTNTIGKLGDDTSGGNKAKIDAHKMMRVKTSSASMVLPPNLTECAGYLKMSFYAKNKVPAPVTESDHNQKFFRQRWCEIKGQYVYYAHHEDDRFDGVIDLSKCELIDVSSPRDDHHAGLPSPSPFSFALRIHNHKSRYPYYFLANGDDEKEQWFKHLRRACNRFSFIRSDLYVGQAVRVFFDDERKYGVCKWIGHHGAENEECLWVGVEMGEEIEGGHTGGDLFTAEKGRGLLIPAYKVAASSPLEIQVVGEKLALEHHTPSQFEFLNVIGKGSFGRVCKVREIATGEIFAIKILQKGALLKESQITNVRREKSILLNICHPFIVKLHAAFQTKGRLFLLFDFLSGGELFHHVQKRSGGHLPESAALFYLAEVSLAISHLHKMQIIHRDLKAENLVLDKDGHVVLTDFGFAKTVLPTEHNTTRCGTLPYMAPEILRQSAVGYGFEVDWWSFGVLSFLLLTGCYPFWHQEPREAMKQILYRKITMSTFPAHPPMSEEARECVLRCIDKDPRTRLSSVEELSKQGWFKDIDFQVCELRGLTPPFIPEQHGKNTKYFDIEGGGVGESKPLPKDWCKDAAFASFYDIHTDYKKLSEKINSDGSNITQENMLILDQLNNWNPGSTEDSDVEKPDTFTLDT